MKGRRHVKERFLSLETIETWIVYVCPIQRVNGQDKIFKSLSTEYGSRCQAHWFECVKNCNAAGFFTLKNGPPPKGHPANLTQMWETLESSWASIPVERFRHLVVHTLTYGRKGVQCFVHSGFLPPYLSRITNTSTLFVLTLIPN